jgi:hypothetical protein
VRWQLGAVTLTVVPEPEFEVLVPQDERTTQTVLAHPWLAPYRTDEGVLRVTTSAIAVQTPETCVVIDPWVALDGEDRTSDDSKGRAVRRFDALARAGIGPADVDVVVNSHIDGIGANTSPSDRARDRPHVPAPGIAREPRRRSSRRGSGDERGDSTCDVGALCPRPRPAHRAALRAARRRVRGS